MFGYIELLQQEPERSDLQFCDLIIAEVDGEPKIAVERSGNSEIFGGHERLDVGYGTRKHSFLHRENVGKPPSVYLVPS